MNVASLIVGCLLESEGDPELEKALDFIEKQPGFNPNMRPMLRQQMMAAVQKYGSVQAANKALTGQNAQLRGNVKKQAQQLNRHFSHMPQWRDIYADISRW